MKKNLALSALTAIAAVALVFTGCDEPETVKVSSITVTPATVTLDVDGTTTLTAAVLPADAEDATYTWSSSAEAVATVSTAGVVTAKGPGTAIITATANDGSGMKGSSTVTVNPIVYATIAGDGFNIDEAQTINKSEAAGESRKIDITSRDGIAKLLVDIENPRIDAMMALMGMTGGFPELDLATPGNNAALLATIAGMGLTLPSGDAVKGKKALTIDMDAAFIGALVTLGEGTTAIKLTVVDAAEHAVTKTLTITIVDDLKLEITGSVGTDPIEIKMSDAMADPIAIEPVAVDIVAGQGIETFKVLIESSSLAFTGGLAAMGITGEFDLANPGEALAGALALVGLIDPANPVAGATELNFNITGFIPMIFGIRAEAGETGDCTASFKLTVTDAAEQTKEATISLSLVDDSAAGAE